MVFEHVFTYTCYYFGWLPASCVHLHRRSRSLPIMNRQKSPKEYGNMLQHLLASHSYGIASYRFGWLQWFKDVFCSPLLIFQGAAHDARDHTTVSTLSPQPPSKAGIFCGSCGRQDFVVVYWGQISTNHNRVEVWSIFGGDGQLPARIRAMTSGIHQRPLASSHTFTSSLKAVDASGCQWMPVVRASWNFGKLGKLMLRNWCFCRQATFSAIAQNMGWLGCWLAGPATSTRSNLDELVSWLEHRGWNRGCGTHTSAEVLPHSDF